MMVCHYVGVSIDFFAVLDGLSEARGKFALFDNLFQSLLGQVRSLGLHLCSLEIN